MSKSLRHTHQQRSIWFAAGNWFCSLVVKSKDKPIIIAFVDWYRSPESPNAGSAVNAETGLPVIEPMSKSENNKWSRWVFMENVEPVNVMLGKLQGVRGYFAIRMGPSDCSNKHENFPIVSNKNPVF